MADQDVSIKVTAVDQASGVLQKTAAALKNMRRESRMQGENAFASTFGSPQGIVNAVLDKAGVGLAGLALELSGKLLADVTSKAVELRDAFHDGSKSASEIALELGKTVPIYGHFFSAGENINELLTHQKANIKELNAEMERGVQLSDARLAVERKMQEVRKASRDYARDVNNQMSLIGMVDPEATHEKLRQQRDNAIKAAEEKYKNPTEEENALRPKLADAQARRHDLEAQLSDIQEEQKKYERIIAQRGVRPATETDFASRMAPIIEKLNAARLDETSAQGALNRASGTRQSAKESDKTKAVDLAKKQIKEFDREIGLQRAEDARKAANQVKTIESETRQIAMRAQYKETEAQLDSLRTLRENELSDISASANARIRKESDPKQRAQIHEEEWAKRAAVVEKYQAQIDATMKQGLQKKLADDEAVTKFVRDLRTGDVMGPHLPANPLLTSAWSPSTVRPGLTQSNGLGIAARQREESDARDVNTQRQLKQIEILVGIEKHLGNLVRATQNPPAGPPALSAY